MAKAKLQIAHQVPGRIRMKIPSAKGNPEQLEDYRETLSLIPGIESVEVNPETGSIILKYDPDRHDHFHAGFHDHCRDHHDHHHRPPTNEIDALASKIEEEAEFLAEQMEWREGLEEADRVGDTCTLVRFDQDVKKEMDATFARLAGQLDRGEAEAAAATVRQLMFFDRFKEDVAEVRERSGPRVKGTTQ